jgi:hypothetical protein
MTTESFFNGLLAELPICLIAITDLFDDGNCPAR